MNEEENKEELPSYPSIKPLSAIEYFIYQTP